MLPGIAGAPIRPESYAQANIVGGRVGIVQTSPAAEMLEGTLDSNRDGSVADDISGIIDRAFGRS
jgi:hypothetical protein